ncbi:MAG: aminopeptidase N, partial [Snodgrassella alvi]|nr:aminopeptidase N [Snodgrassella alvi]
IEGVIGHEYFHNWTGNRVTCRDWFQLSLKEGLTVFRDQEFSADRASRAVRRIHNVRVLRSMQFAEDAGPMAHPVRPASYEEMNNFYTLTVYEKGAEVVRMYHTLLGEEGFQKGMQLYFQRHDGQAVTCDDFRAAMADANGVNLDQFALWYSQAGTPQIKAHGDYDAHNQTFSLHLQQFIPPTPDMADKQPMVIPVKIGLLDKNGASVAFKMAGTADKTEETVLVFNQTEQTFVFHDVAKEVVPSLLRGFSAPVRLDYPYSDADLMLLLAHDSDSFARWEAAQTLYRRAFASNLDALASGQPLPQHAELVQALTSALNADIDPAYKAVLLQVPTEAELWEDVSSINPEQYVCARQALLQSLASSMQDTLTHWREWADEQERTSRHQAPQEYHPDLAGVRSLHNTLLQWGVLATADLLHNIVNEFSQRATNMTHEYGMLAAINHLSDDKRNDLLNQFGRRHAQDDLVMDKYFILIGSSQRPDTLQQVEKALQHPAFSLENPNKVRSLLGSFSRNIPHFHAADGSGYRFLADYILRIDEFNPQVASRLVQAFNLYDRLEPRRKTLMAEQLQRIQKHEGLSKDSREIVDKILHS